MSKNSIAFALLLLLGTACQRNLEVQTSQRNCPLKSGVIKPAEWPGKIIITPAADLKIAADQNTDVHAMAVGRVAAVDEQLKLILVKGESYYFVYKNVESEVQINEFVSLNQRIGRLVSDEKELGLQVWQELEKLPAKDVARMCDCDSHIPVRNKN